MGNTTAWREFRSALKVVNTRTTSNPEFGVFLLRSALGGAENPPCLVFGRRLVVSIMNKQRFTAATEGPSDSV